MSCSIIRNSCSTCRTDLRSLSEEAFCLAMLNWCGAALKRMPDDAFGNTYKRCLEAIEDGEGTRMNRGTKDCSSVIFFRASSALFAPSHVPREIAPRAPLSARHRHHLLPVD